MKKEGSGDLKSVTSSGSQNIKGLWKRAFQSLRKDKTDKDPVKRKENGSQSTDPQTPEGEVDPVYHLLRCAASKSQTTAMATTGIINTKTNSKSKSLVTDASMPSSSELGQFTRSDYNETNVYPGSILLRKTSTTTTFKLNELDSHQLNEYLLETNINTNNSNSNQRSKESECNISRSNEYKSIKSNALISSNMKLSPQFPIAEQQIINVDEAELAYEQHKRMNPRQKTLRSSQKGPLLLIEDYPQSLYATDYGYESEPKSFTSTDDMKSHKQLSGYNSKSFGSALRTSNEKVNPFSRMKIMSMEESENDDMDVDKSNNNNSVNYNIQDNDNYKGKMSYYNTSYTRSDNSTSLISPKYTPNISSSSRKPYNYDETSQLTTQVSTLEDRIKKNPLLSMKSFSLDVPQFDKPYDPNSIGSGGSSPGRYSEGFRKSSVVKQYSHLLSEGSPSSFSPRMNGKFMMINIS
ncbi:cement precursor 3B variant 2 isoform 3 [Schistosoma japonicum]|uniref:Cement 3B variant 2 isoform 3 n=1 Tax=Schistosoma japonicum TaxID=6182 RepID=A0A4Z2DES8_SCHJA|nr:cement precursor 3B variant 2 isoform 3 [Schistosoma japonicum]